jgi:hypothetical protein
LIINRQGAKDAKRLLIKIQSLIARVPAVAGFMNIEFVFAWRSWRLGG